MDAFSSSAEDVINRKVVLDDNASDTIELSSEEDLIDTFNLEGCLQFILKKGFEKVCLQFPDHLLEYSVRVTLWLEKYTKQKLFILADTSYGSCCVDEIAAQHVDADAIIHMGHACLSPTSRLPVFYVLPKAKLNLQELISPFKEYYTGSTGQILVLYDVAFNHLYDNIKAGLSEFEDRVVLSDLERVNDSEARACCSSCALTRGSQSHRKTLLARSHCCDSPSSIVYIAYKQQQSALNFALSFRDVPIFTYTEGEMKTVEFNKTLRRRLFLIEKIKDVKTLGIIVATLSVDKFLDAIERVKKLAKLRGKRSYIISVGKPNPAKLANFPEIELFVMVGCPEARLEDEKQYMQPVVSLLEAELALNPEHAWDDKLSIDFRDLLQGGANHKPLPESCDPLEADVSLISNKIRSDEPTLDSGTSTQLCVRESYQISVANSYHTSRSWRGLEQRLGETPVTEAVLGRSGIPIAYDQEPQQS